MITYDKSAFGLNLILRVHGSAVYRSVLPALLSVGCLILFRKCYREAYLYPGGYDRNDEDIQHPYAVGVLVASTTFLIIFRANQGYARYWEATSAVHHMMSKWMDAAIHTAVFHMQCSHYDAMKPPSYYDHPELNQLFLTRARERGRTQSTSGGVWETGSTIQERALDKSINVVNLRSEPSRRSLLVGGKTMASVRNLDAEHPLRRRKPKQFCESSAETCDSTIPRPLQGEAKLDGNWGNLFPNDGKATYFNPKEHGHDFLFESAMELPSFASHQGGRTPPLFLQELSHLASLMAAVALATLRNDIDGSMSPLGVYTPGSPWPEVDSDKIANFNLNGPWYTRFWLRFLYLLGAGTTPEERTRYNAARPLPVLGGVSDNEILFLQMARGPQAKFQLCWAWLSEFIMREHIAGSLGKVGPPIVSRIIQFLSDGNIYYNHARKIMFIPFPFPHAQLSAIFVLVTIPAIAFLMEQYAENIIVGAILTFFSVMCLSGVHEVARELENPFRNIPNELPVVTFQAQFNETLITMFSGFHPDHYWNASDYNPLDKVGTPATTSSTTTTTTATSKATTATPEKSVPSPKKVDAMPIPSPSQPETPASKINISHRSCTSTASSHQVATSPCPTYTAAVSSTTASSYSPASHLHYPSSPPSPAVSATSSSSSSEDDTEQLLYLQRKIEEYGNEVDRLTSKQKNQ